MDYVMSLILFPMSKGFMSHVDFRKWPCYPIGFKGQEPNYSHKVPRPLGAMTFEMSDFQACPYRLPVVGF